MAQCVVVFKSVGIPKAVLARLSGFARMQVFRWFTGRSVRPLRVTLEYVSELAYKMIRADNAGRLPEPGSAKMPPWARALEDSGYETPMNQTRLDDLMTPKWSAILKITGETEDVAA